MLNKVKYLLLVIGLLFLIPACTAEPTQQELAAEVAAAKAAKAAAKAAKAAAKAAKKE